MRLKQWLSIWEKKIIKPLTSHHTQNQRPIVGKKNPNNTLKGQHRGISLFHGFGRGKELFNYREIGIILEENN